jgi:hypothetical protein
MIKTDGVKSEVVAPAAIVITPQKKEEGTGQVDVKMQE